MFDNHAPQCGPRSWFTSVLGSVVIHAVVLLGVFLVHSTVRPYLSRYVATQLYVPAAPSPKPARVAVQHWIAPHPAALLPKLPAPQLIADLPAPPELAATRPAPPPLRQPVLSSPAPPPPSPPSPVFASALPASAPSVPPVRAPQTGAFGAAPATAAPAAVAKLQVVAGAFGTVPADAPRHTAATATAAVSGFGAAVVTASNAGRGPSVAAAGAFGGVAAGAAAESSPPKLRTAATAFGSAVVADPARRSAASLPSAAEALEILFKPRPAYTEEARRARIEGDVVLEVLFPCAGPLRVQRVVHGLGYGLDQNALDAAAKIRFRPATEDGHPVDTVTTIRISFQMAY